MNINDDYIALDGKWWSFYYGCEVLSCTQCSNIGDEVDDDENCKQNHEHEWCFKSTLCTGMTKSEKIIPFSKLGTKYMFNMTENFGAGMKIALNEMVGNIQRMAGNAKSEKVQGPETEELEIDENYWFVFNINSQWVVRKDEWDGFACDRRRLKDGRIFKSRSGAEKLAKAKNDQFKNEGK